MSKEYNLAHLFFIPACFLFVIVLFLFDQKSAAILIGSIAAFITDPSLFLSGIILGFLGSNYKQFCLITYPVAIFIAVLTTVLFINPWHQKINGHNADLSIYIYRTFSVLFIAHICQLAKTEIKRIKIKIR